MNDQALEERVARLEEENAELRRALRVVGDVTTTALTFGQPCTRPATSPSPGP